MSFDPPKCTNHRGQLSTLNALMHPGERAKRDRSFLSYHYFPRGKTFSLPRGIATSSIPESMVSRVNREKLEISRSGRHQVQSFPHQDSVAPNLLK